MDSLYVKSYSWYPAGLSHFMKRGGNLRVIYDTAPMVTEWKELVSMIMVQTLGMLLSGRFMTRKVFGIHKLTHSTRCIAVEVQCWVLPASVPVCLSILGNIRNSSHRLRYINLSTHKRLRTPTSIFIKVWINEKKHCHCRLKDRNSKGLACVRAVATAVALLIIYHRHCYRRLLPCRYDINTI